MFCENCLETICNNCIIQEAHSGHVCKGFTEKEDLVKKITSASLTRFSKANELNELLIKNVKINCERISKEASNFKKQIEEDFDKLINKLQGKKVELLKSFTEQMEVNTKSLNKFGLLLENLKSEFQKASKNILMMNKQSIYGVHNWKLLIEEAKKIDDLFSFYSLSKKRVPILQSAIVESKVLDFKKINQDIDNIKLPISQEIQMKEIVSKKLEIFSNYEGMFKFFTIRNDLKNFKILNFSKNPTWEKLTTEKNHSGKLAFTKMTPQQINTIITMVIIM